MPSHRLPSLVLVLTLLPALVAPPARGEEWFVDRGAETNLDFVHFNGMSGRFFYPEMTGSGAAFFDYDGDGDLDVYVVQGHMMGPGVGVDEAIFPPRRPDPQSDRLYRNDLAPGPDGRNVLRFVDVTERAGISAPGYGMGVATGDLDNDGDVDLYVTNFGANQLLLNRGDGTFEDATEASGAQDSRWSVAAAFLDFDDDGWLDLYVGNYVDFTYSVHKDCSTSTGTRDYCGPLAYDPEQDRLFRNRGDGTLEDVTVAAGLAQHSGTTLGAVASDFDGDGRVDLYVANDMMANFLWINQGDGTFRDDALLSGAAVNAEGQAEASMGVDAADFDGDGDDDLFMAHLTGETNTLYLNDGRGVFRDATAELGLGNPSWNFTAFGTAWFDFDNDGWLDVLTVNGAVKMIEALARAEDPYPLHQTNQLFRNLDGRGFEEVTARAGAVFELSEVSRGAAFGDIDEDGDTDVLVVNNAGPARLLVNEFAVDPGFAELRLLLEPGPRDAHGAKARFILEDGRSIWRRLRTEGSYASANEPRVRTGLGPEGRLASIEVLWPDGHRTRILSPPERHRLRFVSSPSGDRQ